MTTRHPFIIRHRPSAPGGAWARRPQRSEMLWWSLVLPLVLLSLLLAPRTQAYDIEINKANRLLVVRDGAEVVREFRISSGRGGRGDKHQQGDNRTPIGNYRVTGFNARSRFDYFVRLNYPNVKDAFYGLKDGLISRGEFDAIVAALRAGRQPPQNTALGGAIGIHGIGEETPEKIHIHSALDWTEGCIALRNEEIHELRNFLRVGTRVVITE